MISVQKGTKDILQDESYVWQFLEEKACDVFSKANYKEIRTPIFESTELFSRGVGDSTDIVNKEMYTFKQNDKSITLRPENTAGVVRAYIEHGMQRLSPPVKLFYHGPMFRYERPQAGRQRQFHQVGVELFGVSEPSADAEVIMMAIEYLNSIGLNHLTLEINSLGCPDCREEFREKLKNAIKPNLEYFCDDCKFRFEKNPLRILDCKNESCQKYLEDENIKNIINNEFICDDCKLHFDLLKKYLDNVGINYNVNKLLVRGLDYYTRTVFEIKSNSLGSQNAVCGGGRYDNLVETLGGVHTPAVGFAMGMERLISLLPEKTSKSLDVFVVSNNVGETLKLVKELRKQNICCDFDLQNKKFSRQLEKAIKSNAKFAIILGEDEIKENKITIKNLYEKTQQTVDKVDFLSFLKK